MQLSNHMFILVWNVNLRIDMIVNVYFDDLDRMSNCDIGFASVVCMDF